jgi:small conductance mechanosensitive channel
MSNEAVSQAISTQPDVEEFLGDRLGEQADNLTNAMDWLSNNSHIIFGYMLNIISAILILVIGFALASFISKIVRNVMGKRGVESTVANFITNMVHYIAIGIVLIAGLSKIGVQTGSFIALIGAAGLAVGLALQGSLSNFASGILIITLRPFKAGDYIDVAGTSGTVESVAIFATTLTSVDNKSIIVPNSSILNDSITNYSTNDTRRIDLVIGVSYSANLADTKAVLEEILNRNILILKDPAYTVAVAELGDSSVNLVVRPWVKTTDYWTVRFELIEDIKNALDKAGIEIPFPQVDVHLNQ